MRGERIDHLRALRRRLYEGGGAKRIEKQHAAGKRTARERLALLFDRETFQETYLFMRQRCTHFGMEQQDLPADGRRHRLRVGGRPAGLRGEPGLHGGRRVGRRGQREKIWETMDAALKTGDPFVFINDGGGARIQEGVDSLSGYGGIFYRNVLMSGVVPQMSIIAGPCAGGAAYSPALTDFIIQVRHEGQLYITGPARDQRGHRRGRDRRAARRRGEPRLLLRRRALHRGGRRRRPGDHQAAAVVPAEQQHRRAPVPPGAARGGARPRSTPSPPSCRTTRASPTTCTR